MDCKKRRLMRVDGEAVGYEDGGRWRKIDGGRKMEGERRGEREVEGAPTIAWPTMKLVTLYCQLHRRAV